MHNQNNQTDDEVLIGILEKYDPEAAEQYKQSLQQIENTAPSTSAAKLKDTLGTSNQLLAKIDEIQPHLTDEDKAKLLGILAHTNGAAHETGARLDHIERTDRIDEISRIDHSAVQPIQQPGDTPKRAVTTGTPRKFKQIITAVAATLAIGVFFVLLEYFHAAGDTLLAFQQLMFYFILIVGPMLTLIILGFSLQEQTKNLPDKYVYTIIGLVIASFVFLAQLWEFGMPLYIHSLIAKNGTVSSAKVLHYDLYNHEGKYQDTVKTFSQAQFVRIFVQLPDGQKESFSMLRSGLLFSSGTYTGKVKQTVQSELQSGTIQVRYWKQHAWLIRPEVEFEGAS